MPSLCNCLMEIAQDNGLAQLVQEPTRKDNILDLVFTNNPTLFCNIKSMPPLSTQADHNTVFADMTIKPKTAKQPARNVFKYHKANWPKIKEEISLLSNTILSKDTDITVQEMWNSIEEKLTGLIEKCVPSKKIRGYKNPPWFNKEIKAIFQSETQLTGNGSAQDHILMNWPSET